MIRDTKFSEAMLVGDCIDLLVKAWCAQSVIDSEAVA